MDPNSHSIFSGNTPSSAIDPMFSTFSLQSLLTFNHSFFTDNFHAITDDPHQLPNLPQSITDQTPYLNNNKNVLIVPKTEHPLNLPPLQEYLPLQQQPFNFLPQYYPPFETFHRLPQLHSSEHSNKKRLRHPFTEEITPPPPQKQPHFVRGKSPSLIPQSKLARQRRQTLSDKTRCLQKLMPWDKKMDQATLFEEAYKYVKFLQAQISALHSMPSQSTTNTTYSGGDDDGVFAELKKLNRNQALQVVVNSPVAQTKLYSQGYCVFSMEQICLLRKISERRQQQQQLNMSDNASSSKTFFL
ncbi:transcription factor bHLH117-like [Vicia villosa]|uniref:transcription factor bHLH117-like n=1 Tax=Vicia villosa TaxID=3911 RepID=UPI00273BAFA0|nr:transcription factor bHLH117-like [Vicia villosa]